MPSGDKNIIKSSNLATSTPTNEKPSAASENCASSAILAPRFTIEEKKILYNLFEEHEDVIDIKNRKKQKGKYCVRDAWQAIVDGYNEHPNITINRNLKQIQKFWLNARLRKQYPMRPRADTKPNIAQRVSAVVTTSTSTIASASQQQPVRTVPAPIKCEPEISLPTRDSPDTTGNADEDEYEEVELEGAPVDDPLTVESLEESAEDEQIQQENDLQTEHEDNQDQEQHHENVTVQSQQISVDQISADKLSLNDLLHFKTTRPREDIIIQIKNLDGEPITYPSPNRTTIPQQQSTYNQITSDIKIQPQTSHIQVQHYEPQPIQQQQQIQPQYNATNSTFYNYTTQHLPIISTSTNVGQPTICGNATNLMVTNSFEDKINYFKLKDAELRCKEAQLQIDKKRIELSRMQEDLRHQKELHRLQREEMVVKVRILREDEKRILRNKES